MNETALKILGYLAAYFGGLFTMASRDWVTEYFKRKEELRNKLERPYNLTSDIVAVGSKDGFTKFPTKTLFERGFKVAARLETLNKKGIALNLRQFINKWNEYASLVTQLKKDPSQNSLENIERQLDKRKELDGLSDKILNDISEEYKIKVFPEKLSQKSIK